MASPSWCVLEQGTGSAGRIVPRRICHVLVVHCGRTTLVLCLVAGFGLSARPHVMPPAEAGEDFTRNVSGEMAQSEAGYTRNVSGDCTPLDCDRSSGIGSPVVVVQQTNSCCLDIKQTTTTYAHARVCEGGTDHYRHISGNRKRFRVTRTRMRTWLCLPTQRLACRRQWRGEAPRLAISGASSGTYSSGAGNEMLARCDLLMQHSPTGCSRAGRG